MREVTMLDAEPIQTTFMQQMNSHTGTILSLLKLFNRKRLLCIKINTFKILLATKYDFVYRLSQNRDIKENFQQQKPIQCCGARAARSRKMLVEPESMP
jgi:hypothetical protein